MTTMSRHVAPCHPNTSSAPFLSELSKKSSRGQSLCQMSPWRPNHTEMANLCVLAMTVQLQPIHLGIVQGVQGVQGVQFTSVVIQIVHTNRFHRTLYVPLQYSYNKSIRDTN